MYMDNTIGVVVPAYNEQLLIGPTLAGIPQYVDKIYAIDDASTDDTGLVVQEFQKIDPRIVYIRHEKNSGVGAAIISGYRQAFEDGIDIMAVMAGDDQMDPLQLHKLLEPIIQGKADYTKGNRLYSKESRQGMCGVRSFGNSTLTILNRISSGCWHITDSQNGYTAISRAVFNKLSLDSIYTRYGYCNNMLTKLNVYGFRILDIQMPARYGSEKSKIRYGRDIPRISWLLSKDFLWRMYVKYIVFDFHPLVVFYLFGAVMTGMAVMGGLNYLYMLVVGYSLSGWAKSSLPLLLIGIIFLLFAMLMDKQNNGVEQKQDGWLVDAGLHLK